MVSRAGETILCTLTVQSAITATQKINANVPTAKLCADEDAERLKVCEADHADAKALTSLATNWRSIVATIMAGSHQHGAQVSLA
jgi:thiamine biosynthesis protein ThiC